MEELLEMRQLLEAHRYPEALELLAQLEEMSREDKIGKIESFVHVLILHLIKRHAEQKTTVSWDLSIKGALRYIDRTNKRQRAGSYYLAAAALGELIADSYEYALDVAAAEAFGGAFSPAQLAERLDADAIQAEALSLIQTFAK